MTVHQRCVILNGDYSYLNTVSWKRAVTLIIKGKTEAIKYTDKVINCINGTVIKIPSVMKLIKVIRIIYRNKIPYSKTNVMMRDHHMCGYCGSTKTLTIDHVIPVSRGGKTTFENCVTACRECNLKKKNRTPSEAHMYLRHKLTAPTISEFFRLRMKQIGIDEYLKELGVF